MKNVFWLLTMLFAGFGLMALHPVVPPTTNSTTLERNAILPDDGKGVGIQFTEGAWRDMLKKAKAENKIIFLDAYASWCGPCKMLQKYVFTDKAVGDFYNSKFINVKMDMEKGEGPALSQVYPLEAYPTLMYIDGNGKLLKKFIGAPKAHALIALGKSVR